MLPRDDPETGDWPKPDAKPEDDAPKPDTQPPGDTPDPDALPDGGSGGGVDAPRDPDDAGFHM